MSNKNRGSRAAVAAMVVVVLAMSAVSAQAATKRVALGQKQASTVQKVSDSYRSLRQAVASWMQRYWEIPEFDLPFSPVPRELTR